MTIPAHADQAIDEYLGQLRELLVGEHADLTGFDPKEVANATFRLLSHRPNLLAEKVGPFYDTKTLAGWLQITRQALEKRARANRVLCCVSADGVRAYPVWQFTDAGTLIRGLDEVLPALAQGHQDGWTHALWLTTPDEDLDGVSAITWLGDGGPVEVVVTQARHDAARWAA